MADAWDHCEQLSAETTSFSFWLIHKEKWQRMPVTASPEHQECRHNEFFQILLTFIKISLKSHMRSRRPSLKTISSILMLLCYIYKIQIQRIFSNNSQRMSVWSGWPNSTNSSDGSDSVDRNSECVFIFIECVASHACRLLEKWAKLLRP